MKKRYLNAVLFIVVLLAVAFCGLFLGQRHMHNKMKDMHVDSTSAWHNVLHEKLHLTAEQETYFKNLEKEYLQSKLQLKEKMRRANMKLADALREDQAYTPRVQEAVDEVHHVMGNMQKHTIKHLLSMRPILTKEQNAELEQLVTDALYQNKE